MVASGERERVAFLVRRAGFGASQEELQQALEQGFDETLRALLNPPAREAELDAVLGTIQGHLLDLTNLQDAQTWWLYRMVRTQHPLLEKLTLFWHGHFAVANAKVQNPPAMHRHIELLRAHAFGSYRELLLEVSRDPAMLLWLDGATNKKGAPNENYGRELLELYSVGIGHFDEADVLAAARAFTGWNLRFGAYFFDGMQHDHGEKTFLGQRGAFDGGDIVGLLAGHPATAERLSRKLFSFFAYPRPEPEVLEPLVQAYLSSGYSTRAVLEVLFRSEAFFSERSRYEHVKAPLEYVVGAVRSLGAQVGERGLLPLLQGMGQEILNPPNVAGWPGGRAWVNPSTLIQRFNFAARLASARGESNDGGVVDVASLFGVAVEIDNPGAVVDRTLELLGDLVLSGEARAALTEYARSPLAYPPYIKGQPNVQQRQQAVETRLRGILHLALASTDAQVG